METREKAECTVSRGGAGGKEERKGRGEEIRREDEEKEESLPTSFHITVLIIQEEVRRYHDVMLIR